MSQHGRGGHGFRGPGEKPKNFGKTLKKLIAYSRRYLPVMALALVFAGISTLLQILGPDRVKEMTNEIVKGLPKLVNGLPVLNSIDMKAVQRIGTVLAIYYAASMLLSFGQNYMMATVTQRLSRRMRSDISEKINRLPLKYFNSTTFGDVLSRMTNDVDTVGQTLGQSTGMLVTSITMFIGALVMMFLNSWVLTLTAMASGLLGFLLMSVIMKRTQKYFVAQQEDLGAINGHIEEMYAGHNVVKVYNYSGTSLARFEEINGKLQKSAMRSQFLSGLMMPLMHFVGNLGYVSVCVVGAALAMGGHISFGVIVAFMMYVRLFTQPLAQIAQVLNSLQRTSAAGERVMEFLEEEELSDERHKTRTLENIRGEVEFQHVRFGYVPDKTIIKDFSARVEAGQKVAIVGPTGAGKTTMVNLLMRFYELDSGSILLDGVPIDQVTRENLRAQFGMVLQNSWLFEGTVRENIVYNMPNVTDEEVVDACKAVGLHHFIQTLPDGYDTVLSDKASISTGQKQLVTIARAMIQNSPLLILDEATSSVDTRTERIVQEAMQRLTEGRTSFVIAHRLSTIKNADLILVMKDGDIIESGKHDALLEQGGFYAELYNSQFEVA